MARKTVPVEEEARDFTAYAGKEPTNTMLAFADWLISEVGLEFKTKAHEQEFRDGVRLGGTLRMEFQASDYWKEHDLNPRSPANQNGKAKPAAKGKAKAQVAEDEPEDEPEEDTEDEAPAKPARATRGTGAKPTTRRGTGKPAGKPAGRRGAAAAASTGEAPY
jgi:hypothetical protein